VILYINKDSEEFLDEFRLKGILEKYCKFLPVEIKFGTKQDSVEDGVDKDGKPQYKTVTTDRIINNTSPIWAKAPLELKDEDYLKFYKELYPVLRRSVVLDSPQCRLPLQPDGRSLLSKN
jgi:Molecular chaperone, HSP90 family